MLLWGQNLGNSSGLRLNPVISVFDTFKKLLALVGP